MGLHKTLEKSTAKIQIRLQIPQERIVAYYYCQESPSWKPLAVYDILGEDRMASFVLRKDNKTIINYQLYAVEVIRHYDDSGPSFATSFPVFTAATKSLSQCYPLLCPPQEVYKRF